MEKGHEGVGRAIYGVFQLPGRSPHELNDFSIFTVPQQEEKTMMMMENDKEVQEEPVNEAAEEVSDTVPTSDEPAEEIESEEDHAVNYADFTKADFVARVKELAKEEDVRKAESFLKAIKPFYDELRQQERAVALDKFIKEGGVEDDFEYRLDESDHAFDATSKLIRDRKHQYFKNLEEKKAENLRKKNEILEKLRALIDGEDSAQSFQIFKDLQNEWKQIGQVSMAHVKTLWANYNALIDRFYDHRNIYFELKELDRKKNLEAKIELCAKAEQLISIPRIKDAVHQLNELHHEFKHIGPVPKEDQEPVWQRFKAASDAVYAKRDAFLVDLQAELKTNLDAKLKIEAEVEAFASFTSDRIKEWNQKTQEILAIQKKWDAVGGVPRTKTKDLNKKFWTAFKAFFHNKNLFFKKLDEERDKNLKAKQELVARAIELKSSDDWIKSSNELKNLQRVWKEIGPVPEKQRDKIYKEFKEACDYFFQQQRGSAEKADQEQEENLKRKEAIVEELNQASAGGAGTLESLQELQARFNEIGFVPKQSVASIKNQFSVSVTKYIESISGLNAAEKDQAALEVQLSGLKNDPQAERKLYHKEQSLRKQITKAENDLSTLRNNLEFFGRSKNAAKLKEEFNDKIAVASEELDHLKKQLKLLKSV
ncbi:MAG: DUF349 domain-containing protein [Cyclobacteriaceae bacterium]|nr:DUF349 domain-containing protein [Cyclobacteriaceae bacterium]